MASARRRAEIASATPKVGPLYTLAIVLAALGAGLAAFILVIHQRMAASGGNYTSFCDVSARVSCDVVLGSVYAKVFGLPVAAWGLLAFLAAGAIALAMTRASGQGRLRLAELLLGLSGSMVAIALYFLFVSAAVIRVACPLCLTLDAATIGLFGAAWGIVRLLRPVAPAGWPSWSLVGAFAAGSAVAVAGLAAAQLSGTSASGPLGVAEVRERDPRFYAYYVSQQRAEGVPTEGGFAEGPADAPVTIVEFTDFECPYCARAYQDLRAALSGVPDVRVVVRNFPLSSDCNPNIETVVHDDACRAAAAAFCAADKGRFAEYEALLFGNQEALDAASLANFAARVGLDREEFARCIESPGTKARVAADVAAGTAAGVKSTPTFFMNGRRIAGGFQTVDQYRYAIAVERDLLARDGAAKTGPAAATKP